MVVEKDIQSMKMLRSGFLCIMEENHNDLYMSAPLVNSESDIATHSNTKNYLHAFKLAIWKQNTALDKSLDGPLPQEYAVGALRKLVGSVSVETLV